MSALDTPLLVLDPRGGWIHAPVHVHELHGRPVLMHFWATPCDTCEEHLPQLQAWLQEFQPRGLQVIGVHVPRGPGERAAALDTNALESTAKRLGLHHPLAVDDGAIAASYGVELLPAYLLFDASGQLCYRAAGPSAVNHVRRVLERLTSPEAAPGMYAP